MPKILYFEDDATLAGMFKLKMEREGFEVVYRECPPADPVAFVLEQKPDLIVTDIIMPKMDGFMMTGLLKSNPRTQDYPIFGMSNLGTQEAVDTAISLGMVDYWSGLSRTPAEVVHKIKRILSGDRTREAKASPEPFEVVWSKIVQQRVAPTASIISSAHATTKPLIAFRVFILLSWLAFTLLFFWVFGLFSSRGPSLVENSIFIGIAFAIGLYILWVILSVVNNMIAESYAGLADTKLARRLWWFMALNIIGLVALFLPVFGTSDQPLNIAEHTVDRQWFSFTTVFCFLTLLTLYAVKITFPDKKKVG